MQWAHVLCHRGKHSIKTWLAISLSVQGSKKSSLCDMHNFAYFIFVQGAATFPKRALSYINGKKSIKWWKKRHVSNIHTKIHRTRA